MLVLPENRMPDHNPLALTPEERRAELAAILAAGFLRLRARMCAREDEAARRESSSPEEASGILSDLTGFPAPELPSCGRG